MPSVNTSFADHTLASPALRALVRSVWSMSYAASTDVLPGVIAPDAHVEFVFQTGRPCAILPAGTTQAVPSPSAMIFAQRHGAIRLRPTGENAMLAFRTPPAVAAAILGCSLADCWDRPVALPDLIGEEANRLLDRLVAAPRPSWGAILEAWLISRLSNWGPEHARNLQLQDALIWRVVREPVSTLADNVGLTLRTLRRHCDKHSGLSPKQLIMSGRILRACARLVDRREMPIAEVAHKAGFGDQAAFTNAFRHYVGMTPAQLRSEPIVFCERPRA